MKRHTKEKTDEEKSAVELIGPDLGSGGWKWMGTATGKDGCIHGAPCNASKVLKIDPQAGTAELIGGIPNGNKSKMIRCMAASKNSQVY